MGVNHWTRFIFTHELENTFHICKGGILSIVPWSHDELGTKTKTAEIAL